MEGRGEAERQAWEAQVDEAVAVVSVAGEEAAALLARRRRRRGRGTEVEEDRGDSGEGAVAAGRRPKSGRLRRAFRLRPLGKFPGRYLGRASAG